ncbi:MAG: hypothetical protein GWP48_08685 [Actinobacteria bacterium]|nr:hypothetical protein [Actinomycetota bacterium]
MDRVFLVLGALAVAGLVAGLLGGSRLGKYVQSTHIPQLLDRRDFVRPEAPWLVAVFTSETCDTCAGVWERALHLESSSVAVQQLEISAETKLHKRYRIDAVPTLVVADDDGVVQNAFLGPVTSAELWAAVASTRSDSAQ